MPGPGDASPLGLKPGFSSAVVTAGGHVYVIDGTLDSPTLHYLGGGDARFGNFVEKNWKPDEKQIKKIAKDWISQGN